MAYRSIIIAKHDGSEPQVYTQEGLNLPRVFPALVTENQNKSFQMARTMAGGPGRRIWKSIGADVNKQKFTVVLHNLTWTQAQWIIARSMESPAVILFSTDSGTTRFFATFDETPVAEDNYEINENPDTGLPYQVKLVLSLAILQQTDVDFEEEDP